MLWLEEGNTAFLAVPPFSLQLLMEDPRSSHTLNLKTASTLTEAKAEGEASRSGPHNELWQPPSYNQYLTSEPVLVPAERPCSPEVPSGPEVCMPGSDSREVLEPHVLWGSYPSVWVQGYASPCKPQFPNGLSSR